MIGQAFAPASAKAGRDPPTARVRLKAEAVSGSDETDRVEVLFVGECPGKDLHNSGSHAEVTV